MEKPVVAQETRPEPSPFLQPNGAVLWLFPARKAQTRIHGDEFTNDTLPMEGESNRRNSFRASETTA